MKLSESLWKRITWNLTKFQLNQTTDRKNENNNCLNKLNELKFCEVSQNSISNRCWKFQLSVLKNKKVFFPKKKKKLYRQDRYKKMALSVLIFSNRFLLRHSRLLISRYRQCWVDCKVFFRNYDNDWEGKNLILYMSCPHKKKSCNSVFLHWLFTSWAVKFIHLFSHMTKN